LSSGGFIHGFRYLVRSLHTHLEEKHHQVPWPHETIATNPNNITRDILTRLDSTSSLFQMFGYLTDVYAITCDNTMSFRRYRDVPIDAIPSMHLGSDVIAFLVVYLDFNPDWRVPGADVFLVGRADKTKASEQSNFVHPIFKLFFGVPSQYTEEHMHNGSHKLEYHINEDFQNIWMDKRLSLLVFWTEQLSYALAASSRCAAEAMTKYAWHGYFRERDLPGLQHSFELAKRSGEVWKNATLAKAANLKEYSSYAAKCRTTKHRNEWLQDKYGRFADLRRRFPLAN